MYEAFGIKEEIIELSKKAEKDVFSILQKNKIKAFFSKVDKDELIKLEYVDYIYGNDDCSQKCHANCK